MSLFLASKNNWKWLKKAQTIFFSKYFYTSFIFSLEMAAVCNVPHLPIKLYLSPTYYNSILYLKDYFRRILLKKYNGWKKLFQLFRKQLWKTIVDYLKISFALDFRSMEQYLTESTKHEEWSYWDILNVIFIFLILLHNISYKGLNTFRDSLLSTLVTKIILQSVYTSSLCLSYSLFLSECGSHLGRNRHKGLHSIISVPLIWRH